jgi:hypothetical protein
VRRRRLPRTGRLPRSARIPQREIPGRFTAAARAVRPGRPESTPERFPTTCPEGSRGSRRSSRSRDSQDDLLYADGISPRCRLTKIAVSRRAAKSVKREGRGSLITGLAAGRCRSTIAPIGALIACRVTSETKQRVRKLAQREGITQSWESLQTECRQMTYSGLIDDGCAG